MVQFNPETELKFTNVVFDFHGTLTDHNQRLKESLKFACRECGLPESRVREILLELVTDMAEGEDFKHYAKKYVPEEMFDYFWNTFSLYRDEVFIAVKGLKETLQQLKELGVSVTFLTNGSVRNNDYAARIGEKSTYSNIMWDVLVNRWDLYSGEGDDIPLVISVDDLRFHEAKLGGRTNALVKKPDKLIYDAMKTIISTMHERVFVPEQTLFITDYHTDAEFGRAHGMPTALFLKGFRQYDEYWRNYYMPGGIPNGTVIPYFQIGEIPFMCLYGNEIQKHIVRAGEHEFYVEARRNGREPLYVVKTHFGEIDSPELVEVSSEYSVQKHKVS